MVVINFFIPLALIFKFEAQVTIVCALVGLGMGLVIFKMDGYRRLLALMHLPWVFLVVFLYGRLEEYPLWDWGGIWLRTIIVVNSISLVIDTKDIILYFLGKKEYPIH